MDPTGRMRRNAPGRGATASGSVARPDFNAMKPPPGYVPGVGRGAAGFMTRSDLGPAVPQAMDLDALQANQPSRRKEYEDADDEDDTPEGPGVFDRFMGNDTGALAGRPGEFDEDDREADAVWKQIDEKMDERRKSRREAKMKEEMQKQRMEKPQIATMFRDLKRQLADVPAEAWDAIPDVGDYTVKKQKLEKFAPPPDTLLARAAAEKASLAQLDPAVLKATVGGREEGESASASADLTSVAEGRGTVLSLQLDRASDNVSGQTVVDPKGYLTDLQGIKLRSDADVADLKKARLLLKSIVATNPGHGPGWIAAARLEEVAGKVSAARNLIKKGCEACPQNEDVWLEAARLSQPADAALILARGVTTIPRSVQLWMRAASLEKEDAAKARVLRKALEHIPESVSLWKSLIELADQDDARVLLSRAVECCPRHVDMWLALARLQGYDDARKTLNRARAAIPTEPGVWFAAARLEEANIRSALQGEREAGPANEASVVCNESPHESIDAQADVSASKIIRRAIASLGKHGVEVDRERWLREAVSCEKAQPPSPSTCRALVRACIGVGVDQADARRTFLADAEDQAKSGARLTAMAIFDHSLELFPTDSDLWIKAAHLRVLQAEDTQRQLENAIGKKELLVEAKKHWAEVNGFLERALKNCPQSTGLWLLAATAKKKEGDMIGAGQVLECAMNATPKSQDIFLAAFALEFDQGRDEKASEILAKARDSLEDVRIIWEVSAAFQRIKTSAQMLTDDMDSGHRARESELALLHEALQKYPSDPLLHRMKAELLVLSSRAVEAKEALRVGIKQCAKVAAGEEIEAQESEENMKEKDFDYTQKDLHLPHHFFLACHGYWASTAPLWVYLADLEWDTGSLTRARAALEQGRKARPYCPELWVAAVRLEHQQGKSADAEALMALALKVMPKSGVLWAEALNNTPRVQRKSKAADALGKCPDDGNIIAAVACFFALERKDEKARTWFKRAATSSPRNGDIWAQWLSFEERRGQQEQINDVQTAFMEQRTPPIQGEHWVRNAIKPENARCQLSTLLQQTAQACASQKLPRLG
mmetsp:Transcript_7194/g.44640  ORF Transcript_7194/g.44640 Transcript_7194/m.44640 type:complete len:1061 (-) Transcript_7194:4167-7349(-)